VSGIGDEHPELARTSLHLLDPHGANDPVMHPSDCDLSGGE
jgi:hypothetical protein